MIAKAVVVVVVGIVVPVKVIHDSIYHAPQRRVNKVRVSLEKTGIYEQSYIYL